MMLVFITLTEAICSQKCDSALTRQSKLQMDLSIQKLLKEKNNSYKQTRAKSTENKTINHLFFRRDPLRLLPDLLPGQGYHPPQEGLRVPVRQHLQRHRRLHRARGGLPLRRRARPPKQPPRAQAQHPIR